MFDNYRKRKELEKVVLEYEIQQTQLASKMLSEARNIPADRDSDDANWILHGTSIFTTDSEQQSMLENAFKFYHGNPHARAVIRNLVKFTLGKGPTIVPEDENKKAEEEWGTFKENNNFNHREKEIATRLFRDGEVFLRVFEGAEMKIRFIRANRITAPVDKTTDSKVTFGIECDPNDVETPLFYYKCREDGTLEEKISAEEIIHLKINCDSDQKRGVSILRVVAKRIKQYDDWLEDRIVLNKVRSAIALVKKVESSAAKIKSLREGQLSDNLSETRNKLKMPARGTVITAGKGIEYEMLSPNINATDVKDDGRAMISSIAAGVGFPEMLVSGDWSNSNFASSQVAQNPFIREIEDWQDYFSTFYKRLYKMVIENGIEHSDLPSDTPTECTVEFPPLVLAELKALAEAYEILLKYKIISRKTFAGKMGLDFDLEKAYIEGDAEFDNMFAPQQPGAGGGQPQSKGGAAGTGQGKPGGPTPFKMPIAPVNQFGHEIVDAVKERDWTRLAEILEAYIGKEE